MERIRRGFNDVVRHTGNGDTQTTVGKGLSMILPALSDVFPATYVG